MPCASKISFFGFSSVGGSQGNVLVHISVCCAHFFFFFFLSVCSSPRFVNLLESSNHQAMRNVPLVQLGAEDGPEKGHASNRLVIRGYYY